MVKIRWITALEIQNNILILLSIIIVYFIFFIALMFIGNNIETTLAYIAIIIPFMILIINFYNSYHNDRSKQTTIKDMLLIQLELIKEDAEGIRKNLIRERHPGFYLKELFLKEFIFEVSAPFWDDSLKSLIRDMYKIHDKIILINQYLRDLKKIPLEYENYGKITSQIEYIYEILDKELFPILDKTIDNLK